MFDAVPHAPEVAGLGRATARAGLGLHQLRYVLAAAEHGGFRRAARHLGVQQSAVSRRIHELEMRLGASIFERGPFGVRLTEAGRQFVQGAQGAMGELDLAVDRVSASASQEQRRLRIGVLSGLGVGPLQDLLRQLLVRDPSLIVELVEEEANALRLSLARGDLDVAFLVEAAGPSLAATAWRERLLVALPEGHELEAEAALTWPRIREARLLVPASIVEAVSDLADRRASSALTLVAQNASPASLARLVGLGQGWAIINEGEAVSMAGVVYRPLARAFVAFTTHTGRRLEKPALRRLLGMLPKAA